MSRKLLILLAVLALAVGVLTPVAAGAADETVELSGTQTTVEKSEYGSYIVVMAAKPLLAEFEQDELNSKAAQKKANGLAKGHDKALKDAGADPDAKVNEYVHAVNGFSAFLSYDEALALVADKNVAMVIADELLQPDTDAAPGYIGVSGPASAWQTGYDGEGVVVGIIDTGIWPEHPSFEDDGTFPVPQVVPVPCEFGNTGHNPGDAPFTCNNKLIGARQMLDSYRSFIGAEAFEYDSARDDGGHGTHTASTAAGNGGVEASIYGEYRGTISGIAPRAHVIAYKGLGYLGGFTSDLAAAIDQAVADGVDVINYSIGGGAGEPGADEIAFLFADAAGVFVATSAGNSGPGAATLGNPGTMPWMTTVGANTQERFFEGTVVLGDNSEYGGASVTPGTDGQLPLVDAEAATVDGDDRCIVGTLDPDVVAGNVVLCRRGGSARADKSREVYLAGGAGMIMYDNSDVDNLATDSHWVPSVHIDQTPGLAIKAYIASDPAPTAEITGSTKTEWPYDPSMTVFSSRGPNPVVPDIIKPDITAPGTQILAGYSPTPYEAYDLQGEYFAAIQGTSMSSPVIAGVFALIKQAHPDWSPAMARSAIMTTAYQDVVDNDRTSAADPFDYGAGHVDPGNKVHKGSAFQPGLAYDAGLYEYAAFTCSMDWGIFTPGSCDFLESIGVPMESFNLNYPSIGIASVPGSKTVTRTVTSVAAEKGWRTYNVSVDAPKGFEITVEPSTLKLKSGQSATYTVTVVNESAPIGEWRFGSLTWSEKTGHYDVYSPIAVRGALFDAPASVSGSGMAGAASFDVSFGYTGAYSAAPHGLIADAPTTDNIGQDPDQTYPSGDDSPIGVQKIDFPIADSLFVRWSLVIPGDDDIDLFLEDSSGTIVAASTSGGTNELIELNLPADDTYTMVVHGWSVPNEPLPYTLHFWDVPSASDGTLKIDSAPSSAVQGTTGTIDLSWTGLVAGTEYLGAVSHTAPGVTQLTFVNVNT